MIFLEGLQIQTNQTIGKNIQDILSFVESQLVDDKKMDFLNRKFRETEKIVSVGFTSLSPVKLSIQQEYVKEETNEQILTHEDVFHPLFYGFTITNNQYKRLEGTGVEKLNQKQNVNSFSDYFISRKTLDVVLPLLIQLEVPQALKGSGVKEEILGEFYRIFNEKAEQLSREEAKTVGMDFFIDFNSILKLEISDEEKEVFIQRLFNYNGVCEKVDYQLIKEKSLLNAMVYAFDTICFQSEKLYKIDVSVTNGIPNFTTLMEQEVPLSFEVPTNEKPVLKKPRTPSLKSIDDLPKMTVLEMVLFRYLILSINKQGKVEGSGYNFDLKEGQDRYVTIERSMRITSDAYGNPSISRVMFTDIKKKEAFFERARFLYRVYFGESMTPDESKLEKMFYAKLYSVRDAYMVKNLQEKDLFNRLLTKDASESVARVLYDGAFRNIESRVGGYAEKHKKLLTFNHLIDLLYLIDVMDGKNKWLKGMEYMKRGLTISDLLKKETLNHQELHYLLGQISFETIKGSRNKETNLNKFLRLHRVEEVLKNINKAIEVNVHDIPNVSWVTGVIMSVLPDVQELNMKKQMTPQEKFSYVSGLLSAYDYDNYKKSNKNQNSNEGKGE